MRGNLITQAASSHHAELDVLHSVTRAAPNARICRRAGVAK
jgi:hypothetical protein